MDPLHFVSILLKVRLLMGPPPSLASDAPFKNAQNGNCLLAAAHIQEEFGEGRKR